MPLIRFCSDCCKESVDTSWSDYFGTRLCMDCYNARCEPACTQPDVQVTEDMYAPRSDYYVATFGDFDLDCLTGRGHTPLDAIVDLLDKAEG
jgi:hypothetical protein